MSASAHGTPLGANPILYTSAYEAKGLKYEIGPNVVMFYERGYPFFELTSYYEAPFQAEGAQWLTVEHYYQSLKFADKSIRERIRSARTAQAAVSLGRQLMDSHGRRDWKDQISKAMLVSNHLKFSQNPELAQMLIATGQAKLMLHTTHDPFWGDGGNGQGKNYLGRILEKLREKYMKSRRLQAGIPTPAPPGTPRLAAQPSPQLTASSPTGALAQPGFGLTRTYSQAFPEDAQPMSKPPDLLAESTLRQLLDVLAPAVQQRVMQTFSRLDSDNDGRLSGRDWDRAGLSECSRTRLNQRWKRLRESMDFDNNGSVDPQEFVVALVQHAVREAKVPALALFSQEDAFGQLTENVNKGVLAACEQILVHYGQNE